LAAGREMTPADRHVVIDWLVDQPECEAILTSGLLPLSSVLDALDPGTGFNTSPAGDQPGGHRRLQGPEAPRGRERAD